MSNEKTTTSLEAAERLNPKLNAFLSIDETYAQEKAAQAPEGRLTGIPVAIKDNICVEGLQTTCGSKILEPYRAHYSATAIKRLEAEGAVIIGKTNMDEFAMGSSNENSAYSNVSNPWDPTRVPGGSSGGSAAAVAAGIVDVALGSETGGSVRQPAAFCGVVGLKPTYGRVSRYGLVAFASSLDQIGLFGKSTKDVANTLSVIAGRDENDATTADVAVDDYSANLDHLPETVRIGIPRALFSEGLDPEVRKATEETIEVLEKDGAEIVDVELPHSDYSIAVYYILATAEASSNLARFDGVRYGYRAPGANALREMYAKTRATGFGDEVKRRIMLGTYVLSSGYYDAYYSKAQKVRTLLKNDFENAFSQCDAILTPTSPTTAFKQGERSEDPLAMYLSDIYTASANLAGIPGISVPVGLSEERLPIGVQLLGDHWSEELLLRLSARIEKLQPFDEKPEIHALNS